MLLNFLRVVVLVLIGMVFGYEYFEMFMFAFGVLTIIYFIFSAVALFSSTDNKKDYTQVLISVYTFLLVFIVYTILSHKQTFLPWGCMKCETISLLSDFKIFLLSVIKI